MKFGDFVRSKRIEAKLTLRAFCNRFGYDPANISKLENNKMLPPEDEDKLIALAQALNLPRESTDWVTFFDLASQAHKELPKDIKKEASEAINMLPAFLRTTNNNKIDKNKVKELIKFLSEK